MLSNTAVVTFAGPEHASIQNTFHAQYNDLFGEYYAYNTSWLKSLPFYQENIDLFSFKKYFGYFLWKPFIILDALKKTKCDNVLYCDSNLRFTDFVKFAGYFEDGISREGMFIPKYNHYFNYQWTKRDCFVLMGSDTAKYHLAPQVWTVIMGFKKTEGNIAFLNTYLYYCKIQDIVSELPSKFPELSGFIAHRWEQSVMSILVERYGIEGTLYNNLLDCVDKVYPQEILDLKAEVDKDPLKREE